MEEGTGVTVVYSVTITTGGGESGVVGSPAAVVEDDGTGSWPPAADEDAYVGLGCSDVAVGKMVVKMV